MQALSYSRFSLYQTVQDDLDAVSPSPFPHSPGATSRSVTVVDEPACQVVFEDCFAGGEFTWTCWHDEVHYVTRGRAELDIYEPPTLTHTTTVIVEAGSLYLIPRGTKMVWRVLEGPMRRFTIDFPNPGFPDALAASLRAER